ncbi:MAG: ATP-binding protein [Gammaproteobacteria bacterium]
MEKDSNCPMIVRNVSADGFFRVNEAFRKKVGVSDDELSGKSFLDWIDPADHATVSVIINKGEGSCRANHLMQCGDHFPLIIQATKHDQSVFVLGRCAETGANLIATEDVVDENTVSGTLHIIAKIIEEQLPDYKCSILLVADGHFVRGAGPSLPEDYNSAVDGYAIGPTVGACGTAIYWNVPVIVEDIQSDPLWTDLAELAKGAGVAACWSHPFTSSSGKVLGALALYSSVPQAPTAEQLRLLQAATRMTGLAVERGRAEEALIEKRKRELELEDQLLQAAKMEAIGVLAGGIAHDFNNILATILGNAELALELAPPDHETKIMLGEIIEASQRAGNFCQQLLAYSGKGKVSSTKFELGELLPQISSLVKAALSKKVKLVYALHVNPIFIEGDENQILQVVMNLVINAADAFGNNEGQIEVATKLAYYDIGALNKIAPQEELSEGEYVQLTVKDNGCGIDELNLDRIFDPFFTTKATGRGLGLAAVKGIVIAHGGTIQIKSKVGQGTTFTVLLPVISNYENKESVSDSVVLSNRREIKRVFVVDDDKNLRSIVCRWLKHNGFDVIEATDGQEAIDIFCQNPESIDCILLDLSMPKLSGDEVYRKIKAVKEDVPIILMSGYAEQEILNQFSGFEDVKILHKPVPASDIVTAIRDAIAEHELLEGID